jgi:hypothetical protein
MAYTCDGTDNYDHTFIKSSVVGFFRCKLGGWWLLRYIPLLVNLPVLAAPPARQLSLLPDWWQEKVVSLMSAASIK